MNSANVSNCCNSSCELYIVETFALAVESYSKNFDIFIRISYLVILCEVDDLLQVIL